MIGAPALVTVHPSALLRLPDGADPDSFSRQQGSGALKEYLKEHTQDFISFKIDLYAKDARDPAK